MTDVSTDHPENIPYIELAEEGRQISFRKDCPGAIKIYRKVNEDERELLIQQTRTPYLDKEKFPSGTKLTYSVELEQGNETKKYELKARV
ncbi:hypothetical protein [Nafulsella turpanensis]|uniref:hypothetical protein n=1 Tax=Nafulsella turpanensis TaxID=1265690 RepID=UPI00034560B7|nr:hypothetical protein [Nafulsella turpanensis]